MREINAFLLVDMLNKLLVKKAVITKSTSPESLRNFIKRLYPFEFDKGLIRFGPNGDGGYLVPNDLDGIEACFSPGVSSISGFELDCIKKNMKVFMADKSVEKPNLDVPEHQYDFLKKFIGCVNNDDYITMDEWVNTNSKSPDSDLLLQMDIEGAEYTSLLHMSPALMNRFRIVIIEFHYFKDLWNQRFFNLVENTFDKILQTHICVHIHPNNYLGVDRKLGIEIPRLAEFTFIRKDRGTFCNYQKRFPHELDFDNTSKKSIVLPKQWYKL